MRSGDSISYEWMYLLLGGWMDGVMSNHEKKNLDLIKIIQFPLKIIICEGSTTLWMSGWVYGWGHVKSLKVE